MVYELSNKVMTVSISDEGAEILEINSKEGISYIWNGNPEYWKRHAPVLFPIVGKVVGNTYTYKEESYKLSQHGFARDRVFNVIEQEDDYITFELQSDERTKELYPFDFSLKIRYTLNDNHVEVKYSVYNKDQDKMYFVIGGHPAFNCPLVEGGKMDDYYIAFEQSEQVKTLGITEEVLLSGAEGCFKGEEIALSHQYFEKGVTIFKDLRSKWISLRSHKHTHSVTLECEGFPFVGIWSPEQGAPFVCIEPWFGHTDYVNASSVIDEKKDMLALQANEIFECSYNIVIQ